MMLVFFSSRGAGEITDDGTPNLSNDLLVPKDFL